MSRSSRWCFPDIHPDPFYKTHSSTASNDACHRRHGSAGVYGAETSSCDAPFSLVNETFNWIEDHLKDEIDFVVWTGDSARHDNDEKIPRTPEQIVDQNEFIVSKFAEVFGRPRNGEHGVDSQQYTIPIVPTFGNNDVMPHNIMLKGPNKWTLRYLDIWRSFIPEAQRHSFQQGGWFYVEAIPQKLAVFSLNTMFFFDSNSGVDGCANKHEPGYEHFEWLRVQLRVMRERGMKAILIGHVPPARTHSKMSWDETCWQKFTLWQRQYRDVVVGSLFGHMNIDHFMLHDFKHLKKDTKKGHLASASALHDADARVSMLVDGELTAASAPDYLSDLGDKWAKLPSPPVTDAEWAEQEENEYSTLSSIRQWVASLLSKPKKGKKPAKGGKRKGYLHEIGGPYGERYSISHVSPSVVPNYFPTIRVFSYNISGLEDIVIPTTPRLPTIPSSGDEEFFNNSAWEEEVRYAIKKSTKRKRKHPKKPKKKYKFKVPAPPSKSTPPGPAYSPQPLTFLGYVQYYANLTHINNDFVQGVSYGPVDDGRGVVGEAKWKEGKHKNRQGRAPKQKPHPKTFRYEVEYNTTHDKHYQMQDLTVRSFLDLAHRIGFDKRGCKKKANAEFVAEDATEDYELMKSKKRKKKNRGTKKHDPSGAWYTFLRRAFVGTKDASDFDREFVTNSADDGEPLQEVMEL